MYTVNAIRNICLLGHSGSGKSALAESLLYITGAIDRMGKNADGNTVCDYDPEESKNFSFIISYASTPASFIRLLSSSLASLALSFNRFVAE